MAADPSAGAPPESVLLQQFAGLKNTVTPERLAMGELQRATNVDLDDAKQPRRRRGSQLKIAGDWHSLYSTQDGRVYGVKDQQLVAVNPDYTTVPLGMYAGVEPLSWTEAGRSVYFASMFVSGRIDMDNSVHRWGALNSEGQWVSPIVNPNEFLGPVNGRLFGKPPLASAICYSNGRIWLANGKTLWCTELYLFDYVDKTRSFLQFEDDITALGGVTDGFYVGTENLCHFLSGPLKEINRINVCAAGVLPGSMVNAIPDGLPNQRTITHAAVLMMTDVGLAVGYDAGTFSLLTDDHFWFPKAQNVAAMVRRQDGFTQYVGVADSGGSPASAARIGDYVDAEIRRFSGV